MRSLALHGLLLITVSFMKTGTKRSDGLLHRAFGYEECKHMGREIGVFRETSNTGISWVF